jgi:hypothetical protein
MLDEGKWFQQNRIEKNYCQHWKEKKPQEERNHKAYNRDAGCASAVPRWHRNEISFRD